MSTPNVDFSSVEPEGLSKAILEAVDTQVAFLSYVRRDDQYDRGKISTFGNRISLGVTTHLGEPFQVLQDKHIGLGELWRAWIENALNASTFLIPFITPSFFKSRVCRWEVARFLDREHQLGRDDLILPIYYIECDLMESPASVTDQLAKELRKHQYVDWRKLRHASRLRVDRAVDELAMSIAKAIGRGA
jgi:F-box protein 11